MQGEGIRCSMVPVSSDFIGIVRVDRDFKEMAAPDR